MFAWKLSRVGVFRRTRVSSADWVDFADRTLVVWPGNWNVRVSKGTWLQMIRLNGGACYSSGKRRRQCVALGRLHKCGLLRGYLSGWLRCKGCTTRRAKCESDEKFKTLVRELELRKEMAGCW